MEISVKDDSLDSENNTSADVLFRWQHKGNSSVSVSTRIAREEPKVTPLAMERDVFGRGRLFSGTIRLPYGKHRFRFLVDGESRHHPELVAEDDEATGELWNVVEVSADNPFRLQLPQKARPDDSTEAVDLINSLREYDLRTTRMRRDGPGVFSLPVPRSAPESSESLPLSPSPPPPPPPPSSCTSPVRPVGAPSAAARGAIAAALRPVALASMGNSGSGDKSLVGHGAAAEGKGVWGDGEAKASAKGASEKADVREGDEKDPVDERKKDGRRGESESMAEGGRANGKVDSLGRMEDLGVDVEALGIGHGQREKGQRMPGPGRGQRGNRNEDDGWSNSGIPGLWDYVPDNAAAAAAASETYRKQEASAAVGACLVSSSVRKDGKLLVAMAGLPARGKTLVARAICRHLDWVGLRCQIFSVGDHRRKEVGVWQPTTYYEPGGEGEKTRKRIASEVLHEALEALRSDIDIAVYDSSNATCQRRKWLAEAVASSGLHAQVVFIETICNDEEMVRQNIDELRRSSPEYREVDGEEAELHFKERIQEYARIYQPLEASENHRFIKLIDGGSQMVTNLISGYIPGRLTLLCLNLHLYPRPIWMSRHGESEFNLQGRIGGDAPLTASGKLYASKLATFMKKEYPLPVPPVLQEGGASDQELVVWTSTMLRTGQTVASMTKDREVIKWSQLNEINAGLMDALTYEDVAAQMPAEYEARKRDKLRYRYPGGESYQDLFIRLEPVIFEMLRHRSPLLVVGHQAILRVLYGYLTGKRPEECPVLQMPLHTLVKLTPKAYTCEEEWHQPLEECADPIGGAGGAPNGTHSSHRSHGSQSA